MDNTLQIKIEKIKSWLGSGTINIFGLPFSGKDTHGKELALYFDGALIGGGDILRSSHGPEHIKKHISTGQLAPTEEYLSIVLPFLKQEKFANKPLILSSVGRWEGEEKSILKATSESGHPTKAVLLLIVSTEESKRRWELSERGRHDDQEEAVLRTRFNEFSEKTLPAIEKYREKGLLLEIDGKPAVQDVTEDIIDKLYTLANTKL
ncbi:MAG: nucleoside monophosphate kinase [bacterium]|nr:nucleoside monophosphate kinase [bacterium]